MSGKSKPSVNQSRSPERLQALASYLIPLQAEIVEDVLGLAEKARQLAPLPRPSDPGEWHGQQGPEGQFFMRHPSMIKDHSRHGGLHSQLIAELVRFLGRIWMS
jgi:hypothetical protein